jgi:predicted nucleic acid-binding protein
MALLLDTGPWVALLSRNDTHHRWAVEQFRRLQPPLLSCEAVVAETCFLLRRSGFDPSLALQFIERDVVQLPFVLQDQINAVSTLFKRYENVPASLADAALIRLAEINDSPLLLTTDSDFQIYRRHGRQTIPTLSPSHSEPS